MPSVQKIFACALCALFSFPFATGALAKKQELPEFTEDGLQRKPDSKMAVVYAEPGAELKDYERIWLVDPYVAFKKNWQRDQARGSVTTRRISDKDIENIKTRLAEEFRLVFSETLEKGGYDLVEEAAGDVLIVRPAIINLDVNAPDIQTAGRSTTYANCAGEMTLYVELYDSVTGDLIAKAMDRRADRGSGGFYTWANSVSNKAAADRILKGWADILLSALDEAKSSSTEAEQKD